ncbi:Predicted PurR-regulated permease PerM [Streptomyces sp. DvalAA-14]|nr:Predicted PurR-regulated permease PerM [Streptomyces sp. DvalAA-14]
MPEKRHWSSALAGGLARLAGRIEDRYAEVSARDAAHQSGSTAEAVTAPADTAGADAVVVPAGAPPKGTPAPAGIPGAGTAARAGGTGRAATGAVSTAQPPSAPAARRPSRPPLDPVTVVPWSMRVAAEVGWRLLVLAGTVWVLMRVIGAVQLVVLAFMAALLITALLQPFVARLKRMGLPRGLATALVFIGGFIVMGLVGWFVVWQVMANIDNLSHSLQDGVAEGKKWLLHSPFHVTEDQINQLAKNLSDAIGSNTKALTDAGLQGVTVIVELLTGMLLAMFSTLFLLYDGPNIWKWVLRLFPEPAREGLAGAGPRAWHTLTLYVRGTVLVALIDAIFIGVGIFCLQVPMAVPLAVLIFLASFVPLVGAVASGHSGGGRARHPGAGHRTAGAGGGAARAADRGPCAAAVHPRPRGAGAPARRGAVGGGRLAGRGHRRRGRGGAAGRGRQHGGQLPARALPGDRGGPRRGRPAAGAGGGVGPGRAGRGARGGTHGGAPAGIRW